MKNFYYSVLFLLLYSYSIYGQCTRNGTFSNSSDVSTSGTAELIYSSTSKKLKFHSNFSTSDGPDVDVYLASEYTFDESGDDLIRIHQSAGSTYQR